MLGCREEAMGKASGIREMGLKIWQLFRLMSCLSSMAHLASRESCTHCGNINMHWEAHASEPRARGHQLASLPAAPQRSPR